MAHFTYIKNNISCGARRDRTDDLLLAKQALSQLSYGPLLPPIIPMPGSVALASDASPYKGVGVRGFEPRTSPLSGVRSNQLSYTPENFRRKFSLHFRVRLSPRSGNFENRIGKSKIEVGVYYSS